MGTKMKELSPNLANLIVDEPVRSTFDPFGSSGSLSFRESKSPISDFCAFALRHCNAGSAMTAAYELRDHLRRGGKLFVTISGALSSFQVGRVLSELIRRGMVHGISATAANFEESFYRYVAHSHYKYIPRYTELTPVQEQELRDAGYRRITDTFLPEEESVRILEPHLVTLWKEAMDAGKSYLPHEYFSVSSATTLLSPIRLETRAIAGRMLPGRAECRSSFRGLKIVPWGISSPPTPIPVN